MSGSLHLALPYAFSWALFLLFCLDLVLVSVLCYYILLQSLRNLFVFHPMRDKKELDRGMRGGEKELEKQMGNLNRIYHVRKKVYCQ